MAVKDGAPFSKDADFTNYVFTVSVDVNKSMSIFLIISIKQSFFQGIFR